MIFSKAARLGCGDQGLVLASDIAEKNEWLDELLTSPDDSTVAVVSELTLIASWSFYDNIRIPLQYANRDLDDAFIDAERVARLAGIDLGGLSSVRPQRARRLQRLQISFLQAIARRADILILDDVFSGLGAAELIRVALLPRAFFHLFPLRKCLLLCLSAPSPDLYLPTLATLKE